MTRRLKMKDLEQATGVGREAIRYYIREGLLPQPHRPGKNVAWYDEHFVERILVIKDLQRKRFLPLHAIKDIVGGDAPPTRAEIEALRDIDGTLFANLPARKPERLSGVAKRVGLRAAEIRRLAASEAFEIVTRRGDQWLEGDALRIVELWAAVRRAGFESELGFVPENLRLYVDVMRWLAREELRLFTHGVAGKRDVATTRKMAEQGIDLVNEMLGLIRKATLLEFIHTGNLPAPSESMAGWGGRRSS